MGTPHICVVEDDEALLQGLRDLLEMHGYRVSPAVDGLDALRVLNSLTEPPDLILSDIRMPRMDGYGFLAAVRQRPEWVSIPFIFLTAKGQRQDIRYGKLQGVDDYVIKPFDFTDLLVSIQAALRRRQELSAWQERRIEVLKQDILKVLHHEFRTPLTYIVAYAEMMANSPSFTHSDELRQMVNGIQRGSERLSALITDFLILAELEAGYGAKIYERRRSVIPDVVAFLELIVEEMRSRSASRGVAINLYHAAGLPPLLADQTYLAAAIRHLLDNAIKFSTPNGEAEISVRVRQEGSYLVIEVEDQGMGIPPAEQEHLFDAFYQVDRHKNEQQGAGSGLAIVRHVALLHGGDIAVRSVLGQGSCFTLRIRVLDLAELAGS